jgi:ABC-type glutathione transport system ATPase component
VRLLKLAGLFGVPVVLTEQYPRGLGPTHPEVRAAFDALGVPKRFVEKTAFGCCGVKPFDAALEELRPGLEPARRQVVIAGIEAHVCVMQTAIELLRAGNQVYLCWECVSGRGAEYRRHALDRMVQVSLERGALWGEVRKRLTADARGLSGGQQQRLCIARALAMEPAVLLMDEPCSALDPGSTQAVEELILHLKREMAIVLVTHSMGQARRVADQVAFFHSGRLVETGPASQVLGQPGTPELAQFLAQ